MPCTLYKNVFQLTLLFVWTIISLQFIHTSKKDRCGLQKWCMRFRKTFDPKLFNRIKFAHINVLDGVCSLDSASKFLQGIIFQVLNFLTSCCTSIVLKYIMNEEWGYLRQFVCGWTHSNHGQKFYWPIRVMRSAEWAWPTSRLECSEREASVLFGHREGGKKWATNAVYHTKPTFVSWLTYADDACSYIIIQWKLHSNWTF